MKVTPCRKIIEHQWRRVGSRITDAAYRGVQNIINKSPFTYTVVRSDDANAFVLPGNHVFVLTGLFKFCHAGWISIGPRTWNCAQSGETRCGTNVGKFTNGNHQAIGPSVWSNGTSYSYFLYQRNNCSTHCHIVESTKWNADRIGIMLASEACYDPRGGQESMSPAWMKIEHCLQCRIIQGNVRMSLDKLPQWLGITCVINSNAELSSVFESWAHQLSPS